MNMNIIQKSFGMRAGNTIPRRYKNAKIQRNAGVAGAIMDFAFASQHALDHEAGWTMVFGGFTCLMVKLTQLSHLKMKELRPQYEEIVARAKKIYSKK